MGTLAERPAIPRRRLSLFGPSWLRDRWRHWSEAQAFSPPPRSEWPAPLRTACVLGLVALAIEFVLFFIWSDFLVHRGELAPDFSTYEQAAYLIAHGHLNPVPTAELGFPFWKNDAELIMWPVAALVRVLPYTLTLKALQAATLVGAEMVGLLWICDIAAIRARRDGTIAVPVALVGIGALLLVANPWYLSAVTFDFHMEPLAALFVILAARDVYSGRRRAWIWAVLSALCGSAGATYIAALGVSMLFTGRCRWRLSAGLAVFGFAWIKAIGVFHAASPLALYDPNLSNASDLQLLEAYVKHPSLVTSALWNNRASLWANLSPTGLFGVLWLPASLPTVVTLLEGALPYHTTGYGLPGSQNIVPEPLLAVGMVAILARLFAGTLGPRRRWLFGGAIAVLAANVLIWAWVWVGPNLDGGRYGPPVSTLTPVTARQAAELRKVQAQMTPADEVVVSPGAMGRFADRQWVRGLGMYGNVMPIDAKRVWFILLTTQTLVPGPSDLYADIEALSGLNPIKLVTHSDGLWVFRWTAPSGVPAVDLPPSASPNEPAWVTPGTAGRTVVTGPAASWHAASTGTRGYVTGAPYWTENPGTFKASVLLAVHSGRAQVQFWNETTHQMLWSRRFASTHGRITYSRTFAISPPSSDPDESAQAPDFTGSGIWQTSGSWPLGGLPPSYKVELRVWTPGGKPNAIRVYHSSLAPA